MAAVARVLEWLFERGGLVAMVSAAIWLPLVGWWWPVRFASALRSACGYFSLGAAGFMIVNCGDRNPLQWPSAMLLVGSLPLYFGARLTYCLARDFARYRERRRDRTTAPPP